MALYLSLPNTKGKLANTVKENTVKEKLIGLMVETKTGLLSACEKLNVSTAAAFADYRNDSTFREAVDFAEALICMHESERILEIADQATNRENSAAISLRVKVRERMRDALLPKWRAARMPLQPQKLEQHMHTHGYTFILSQEQQQQIREQRKRILATTKGSEILLSKEGAQEPAEQPRMMSRAFCGCDNMPDAG